MLPDRRDWRVFLDRLLLFSGAVAAGAAVVFFIAYNWSAFGRFAKFGLLQVLVVGAVIAYWRLGPQRAAAKASLLAAAIFLGALLAFFGQTYQTGADTWELFASWAGLILPWVIVGGFAGLWILWIALLNVAIVLYFLTFPSLLGLAFGPERQLWALFAFNTAVLALWELCALRIAWLAKRWAPRLLAIASGTSVTLLALHAIFNARDTGVITMLAYPVWLAGAYLAYRRWHPDLFVLAGGCLSAIVVVAALLARRFLEGGADAAAFLIIALAVVLMAAASGWWLKQLGQEGRA